MPLFYLFTFTFLLTFSAGGRKARPPTIERTCAFDAKIYKIVDAIFAVSLFVVWDKKYLNFFIFTFNYHRFWSKTCLFFAHFNVQNGPSVFHPERNRRIYHHVIFLVNPASLCKYIISEQRSDVSWNYTAK